MKRSFLHALSLAFACAYLLWASGIIPAIIPAAVPAANKIGNSTKFQLAGTNSGVLAGTLCNDASGNATTVGCDNGGGTVTAVGGTLPITSTGGTTPTIAINNFTGDSGSGGLKGAVPAPASGDSAAGKFLAAGGGWSVPSATGALTRSGFYLTDGSNYYVGGTFQPATLPVAGNFSWVNQGGATETAVGNALVLSAAAGSGSNWRQRLLSIGANTSLTAAMVVTMEPQTFRSAGLVFRESATSKLMVFGINHQASANFDTLSVVRYTSSTQFASTAFLIGNSYTLGKQVFWAQLAISGSNLLFSYSNDGVNYVQVWSETKTTFFTTAPDQWGYGLDNNVSDAGQQSPMYTTLLSFLAQ